MCQKLNRAGVSSKTRSTQVFTGCTDCEETHDQTIGQDKTLECACTQSGSNNGVLVTSDPQSSPGTCTGASCDPQSDCNGSIQVEVQIDGTCYDTPGVWVNAPDDGDPNAQQIKNDFEFGISVTTTCLKETEVGICAAQPNEKVLIVYCAQEEITANEIGRYTYKLHCDCCEEQ